MKKFLRTMMLMAALLAPLASGAQMLVTIGDGGTTTNTYLPAYTLYNNTLSEQIYTPAEVTMPGTITSIAFYNGGSEKTPNIKIYMVNTSQSEFSSTTNWLSVTEADKVFEGNVTFTVGQWTTITLQTPFVYDGASNLGVIVDENMQWSGGLACRVFTSTSNCAMYVYDDNTNYNAVGATYTASSRLNVKNQIQLGIVPADVSCWPAMNPTVVDSLTTPTSLTLSWEDNPENSGATYNVYRILGTDTTLLANVSDTAITIDTLQGNTPYTFGIETDCGGGDLSMMRIIQCRTACVAVTEFPWEENFETYAAGDLNIPCWLNEHISGNGTSVFKVYTSTNGGNATHQLQLPDMSDGTRTLLRLPQMDFDGEEYLLSIDVYRNTSGTSYTSEGVRVFASTDGTIDSAIDLGFLYRNCNQTDNRYVTAETATGWYTYEFPIPFTTTGYIILRGESSYGSSTYMDNLKVVRNLPCKKVMHLAVIDSMTTAESLTLNWFDTLNDGNTYKVYTITPTDSAGVFDTVLAGSDITDTFYTVQNLTPNTDYIFMVVADCGGDGESNGVFVSGHTGCVPLDELPYTMSFEADDLMGTTTTELFPWCWTRINTLTSGTYTYYPYSIASNPYNGSRALYFYAYSGSTYADTTGFILPELDVTTYPMNANRLAFWAKVTSTTPYKCIVVTMEDPADRSTYTVIDTVTVNNTTYTKYSVPLSEANSTDPYVAVIVPRVNAVMYIDDVTLEEMPACLEVTDLAVVDSLTTANTVTLVWRDTLNSGASYSVYVITPTDSAGIFDTTLVGSNISDTTFMVENLTGNTPYTFTVQTNCGGDDAQMIRVSTRTACIVEPIPFSENFSEELVSCWNGASAQASQVFAGTPLTMGAPSTGWNHTTDRDGFTGGHYYKNVYGSSVYHWLITPSIDLAEVESAVLHFDMALTDYSYAAAPEGPYTGGQRFMVIVSTDNGQTWSASNATVWNQTGANADYAFANVPWSEFATYVVNLNQYIGDTVRIAFYCESLTSGGDNDLHIDNVFISEAGAPLVSLPNTMAASIGNPFEIAANLLDGEQPVSYTWSSTMEDAGNASSVASDSVFTITYTAVGNDTVKVIASNAMGVDSAITVVNVACQPANSISIAFGEDGETTLSWNGTAAEYEYALTLQSGTLDTNDVTTTTETSVTIDTLTSGVAYKFYVRAVCGNYHSAWITKNFTPGEYILAANATDTLRTCGAVVYDDGGPNGNYTNSQTSTLVILPPSPDKWLVISGTSQTEGSYDYTTIYNGVGSDREQLFKDNTSSDNTQHTFGPFTCPYGATIEFHADGSTVYAGFAVNVSCIDAPDCLPVQSISVAMPSSDTAIITWPEVEDANGYEFALLNPGDTIDDNTNIVSVSSNSIVIDTLTSGVSYVAWVRTSCGGEESSWTSSSTFIPGIHILSNGVDTLRSCGVVIYDDGGPEGNYSANQNATLVLLPPSENQWLVISGTSQTEGSYDYTTIYEGVGTSGTLLFRDNTSGNSSLYTFGPFMVPSATLTFQSDNSVFYAGFEVHVTCIDAPTCFPPVSIRMLSNNADSLELSWTDTANVGAYWVEYRAAGDTGEWTGFAVTDTAAIIADLSPNTLYDIRVVTVCSSSDSSIAAEASFRTACGVLTDADMPFFESFESYSTGSTAAFPDCWNRLNLTTSSTNYPYVSSSYHHGTGSKSMYAYVYDSARAAYLILPEISDVNTKNIDFWVTRGNSYVTVTVGVMDDPTSAATFVPIQTIVPNTTSTSNWVEYDVNLNSYTGAGTYIAMRFNTVGTSSQYSAYVDEITVSMIPDCPRPYVTVVDSITTAHTATLVWESAAGNFRVEYKKTTDSTWTTESVTDTAVVLTGLDANTAYVARVKAFCGNDSSEYSRDVNFTTTISCPAPGTPRAILTPGDGTVATIVWSDPTASAWQICLNGDTNYIDVTDSATYTFNTLTPEQPYTLKVRRDCTDEQEGYSTWSSTITFVPTDAYSLIVNDGTSTNSYVPIYGTYVDEGIHSRFIIPAADLAQLGFGVINKLVFHASNTSVTWSGASFQVYLTETDATTVSSVVSTTDMEQVYSGSLSIANNKMEIDFTTPYQYMGGNLMIAFEEPTTGSWSSCSWYGISATGASMGGYGTSVSQQNFLPKTTIYFIPGAEPTCFPVSDLQVVEAMTTDESITVTWEDTVNSAATYDVYIINGTDTLAYTSNTTSYTFENLQASTAYTIVVAANCGSDVAMIRSVNARTGCAGGGCTITIVGTDGYGDGWNGGYIDIIQDGSSVGQYSNADSGYDNTPYTDSASIVVCSGSPVTFVWHSGEYDDEVSFVIKNANDSVLYTISDATSLTSGAVFYTATDPCAGAPIVEPDTFYVTLSSADTTMGIVSPAGVTAVLDGHIFTANATPATNYVFTGWVNAAGDTVSTANPYTFTVTADITLIGTFAYSVGIESASLDNVNLFPNPASTSVTINGLEAKASVTLVDINGHVSGQWTAENNTLTIDLTNYATGTYFVRIVGEKAVAVRKLIVK